MNTKKINAGNVKMIAHRGLSGLEKENTCPAFVAAGNRSYYGVETDVHVTKDGKFVIIHDETTERISNGECNINVEENDYSLLENIVLPDVDGTTNRRDIRIPLLEDYINICKKYEKKCVLEIKNHFVPEDLKRLCGEIEELGYIDNVIFISFDLENCIGIRNLLPENAVQWLIGDSEVDVGLIDTLIKYNLDLDIYYKKLTKENVALLHSKGIGVNCWTCDDCADGEALVEMGVDYITSNILE